MPKPPTIRPAIFEPKIKSMHLCSPTLELEWGGDNAE